MIAHALHRLITRSDSGLRPMTTAGHFDDHLEDIEAKNRLDRWATLVTLDSSERLSLFLNSEQDRIEEAGPGGGGVSLGDHRTLPNSIQPFGADEGLPSQYAHLTTSSLSDQKVPKWRKKLLIALPHLGLVVLSMLYTVLGAAIFYYIEAPNESILKWRSLAQINDLYAFFSDDLWQLSQNGSVGSKEQWKAVVDQRLQSLIETLHEAFTDNYVTVDEIRNNQTESVWSFTTSLFFTVTLITTIGYGHLIPKTLDGRLACLIFALFGIPLSLVTTADLGKFLSVYVVKVYYAFSWLYDMVCCKSLRCCLRFCRPGVNQVDELQSQSSSLANGSAMSNNNNIDSEERKVSVIFMIFVLLGYTAFGAGLLQLWEPWTFFESFYYCFITVTTIGFGDIVPQNKSFILATIAYFVLGLVVTTMAVDLVGTQYIRKFHYLGRNVRRVTENAFAHFNGKVIRLGDVFNYAAFLQRSFGLNAEQMDRIAKLPSDYLIECMMHGRQPNLNLFPSLPYIPNDIYYIKWIEQPRTASYTSEKVMASAESLDVTSRCSGKRTPREWYHHMIYEHMKESRF